ncbi:MAG: hypothetical protein Q8O87_03150 [bacterium]|nr:hypothetical protein [bacterium]
MIKRTLAKMLLVVTLSLSIAQPFVFKANAQYVVIDPAAISVQEIIAGTEITNLAQKIFEWGLTFVLETLKKRLLDMMVDQIVQWVQGGGDPKFVTDWGGFLRDAGQAAAGDFAKELGLGFLCDSFSAKIRISLQNSRPFSQRADCTLDDIVGNIQNFANDFRNGGWIAYTESLKPQNNYYGALLMAMEERERRVGTAQSAARDEAISGGGFIGIRGADGTISTPGAVLGATIAKAVGSDIDYIVNADQLASYVAAIADALVNRLIKEGVNGLRGVSTSNAPRGGSISRGSTNDPCAGLSGAALRDCLAYNQTNTSNNVGNRNYLVEQINGTLLPRLSAQNAWADGINTINAFESSATAIYDKLADPNLRPDPYGSCGKPKEQFQQEILLAIDRQKAKIDGLQTKSDSNQIIIDSLVEAKNLLTQTDPNDQVALSQSSGLVQSQLDPFAAEKLRDSARNSRNSINSETTSLLNSFNQEIATCYE